MGLNIFQKLVEVQSALKAKKGRFNKFGGFSYRSAEDILESVKPLLKNHGLVLICSDTISDGYLTATYKLIDSENPKDFVENSAVAIIGEHKGMSAEQNTGCASSYARKYALNGLFAIDDSSADPDAIESKQENTNQSTKEDGNNSIFEAKKRLAKAINEAGIKSPSDVKELVSFMGIDTTSAQGINEFLSLENIKYTIQSAFKRMHEMANQ